MKKIAINSDWLPNIMFRMKKQEYKEQERHYYFFDYLFWLGEITWEHYHKVSFKQPRGSDMLYLLSRFFYIHAGSDHRRSFSG